MATGKWPKKSNRKHPNRFCIFSPVFACFRPFLNLSAHFHTFWAVCFEQCQMVVFVADIEIIRVGDGGRNEILSSG